MRSYLKATILNRGGQIPFIDPVNAAAYLAREDVLAKADNPEALGKEGTSHLVLAVYPGC